MSLKYEPASEPPHTSMYNVSRENIFHHSGRVVFVFGTYTVCKMRICFEHVERVSPLIGHMEDLKRRVSPLLGHMVDSKRTDEPAAFGVW